MAVTNPLHADDAYVNLDITTTRKTSCNPASDNPWYLRTRRAYSVFALSLTTLRMWSDADRLLLRVTPRILSEVSWVMSGSGGGRVFNFPRLLSRKRTSVDLDLFRRRLLSAAQATILSISEALVLILVAGNHAPVREVGYN